METTNADKSNYVPCEACPEISPDILKLLMRIAVLEEENALMKRENSELRDANAVLEEENALMKRENSELLEANAVLVEAKAEQEEVCVAHPVSPNHLELLIEFSKLEEQNSELLNTLQEVLGGSSSGSDAGDLIQELHGEIARLKKENASLLESKEKRIKELDRADYIYKQMSLEITELSSKLRSSEEILKKSENLIKDILSNQ